jgi:hypothetical protein
VFLLLAAPSFSLARSGLLRALWRHLDARDIGQLVQNPVLGGRVAVIHYE